MSENDIPPYWEQDWYKRGRSEAPLRHRGRRGGRSKRDSVWRWHMIAKVVARDGARCGLCGLPVDLDKPVDLDHHIPESMGGPTVLSNLQLACPKCNREKHGRLQARVISPVLQGVGP